MAGTLNYLYDPNQQVYVITECVDPQSPGKRVLIVRPGKVIRVRFDVLVTETKLFYDVQVDRNPGTVALEEDDVFPDRATAVAEYETRI